MKIFIGETIAKRRHEMNMTQEELATRLGVSGQAVSNWEREESYPDVTMLPALSVVLEVSVDEMLGIGRETDEQIIEKWHEDMRDQKTRKRTVLRYYREYPKCYSLMEKLYWWIYRWGGDDTALREAAVDMAKRTLEECTKTDLRMTAAKVLAFLSDDEEADKYIDIFGMRIETKPNIIARRAYERGEIEKARAYFDYEHFWLFICLCTRSAYSEGRWERAVRFYELRENMIKTAGCGSVPEGLWWLHSNLLFFHSAALFALGEKARGYETLEESVDASEKWVSFDVDEPLSVGEFSPFGDVTVRRICKSGEPEVAIYVRNELLGAHDFGFSAIPDEEQIKKMFAPVLEEEEFKKLLARAKAAEERAV